MTNVMLVEDHASFREALAFLIERKAGFKVIAQAGSLSEARQLLTGDVDVALVDLGLPDGSGIEFIKDFRKLNPEGIALVLSASIDPGNSVAAVEAGAAEVLHKTTDVGEIVGVVKRLKTG